jgi:HSP20 family molecular chaperone IbpA
MPWELRILQQRLEGLSNHQVEAWTPAIDVYETESAFVVTANCQD